jgi:hypothetical protein
VTSPFISTTPKPQLRYNAAVSRRLVFDPATCRPDIIITITIMRTGITTQVGTQSRKTRSISSKYAHASSFTGATSSSL